MYLEGEINNKLKLFLPTERSINKEAGTCMFSHNICLKIQKLFDIFREYAYDILNMCVCKVLGCTPLSRFQKRKITSTFRHISQV